MMSARVQDRIRDDKFEIYEVITRYSRGIDRSDLELVRSCFHPDAVSHHAPDFDGSIDQFMDSLPEILARFDGLMHIVCNHMSTTKGNAAVSETYCMGVHWVTDRDDSLNYTSGYRQIDRFEYRDGRWAIAERWVVHEWSLSDAGRATLLPSGPRPDRGPADPIYQALAALTDEA